MAVLAKMINDINFLMTPSIRFSTSFSSNDIRSALFAVFEHGISLVY